MRLRYRDLAAIDPTLPLPAPSVILVRARAIAINLDVGGAIRLIICENQVYILSVPKANDPAVTSLPTEDHPFVKWLCSCLRNSRASSTGCYLNRKNNNKNATAEDSSSDILNGNGTRPTLAETKSSMCSIITPAPSSALTTGVSGEVHHHHHHHNQTFDVDMPYELRALEVSLIAAMGILTAEINDLEAWGVPAVDALLRQVCRETLETVRKLKNSIDRLKAKVQRLVIEISDLLEDDDDMYDLYLGRRAELQGLLPLPQPGEVHDVIDHEIEQAGRGTGGMVGGDVADSIEQEERVREAEEELKERQRERNRARNRERRSEQQRQGGGRSSRQSSHYSGNGNVGANRIHRNHDEDDVYSIADSLHDIDSEEEDALEQAEEDFLLRQRNFDINGGAAAGGGSSLFGGIANRANRIDPHDIEEAEDLLETMFERADMLLRRLSLLDERCEDTEALLELDLDQKRNQLVGLNVVVSSMSMSFGFAAAIGGIFGMNLKNSELAEDGWVLATVLAVMLAGCTALLIIVFWYMQYKKLMFIPTTV